MTQPPSPHGLPLPGVWAAGVSQESPSKPPRSFHPSRRGPSVDTGYSLLCHQDTLAPTLGREKSPVLWPEPRTGLKGTGERTSVFYKLPSTLIHRSWGLYPCSPLGLGAASGPAGDDACAPHSRGPCRPQAPSCTGAPRTVMVFQAARVGSWVRDVSPHQPRVLCKIPTQTVESRTE